MERLTEGLQPHILIWFKRMNRMFRMSLITNSLSQFHPPTETDNHFHNQTHTHTHTSEKLSQFDCMCECVTVCGLASFAAFVSHEFFIIHFGGRFLAQWHFGMALLGGAGGGQRLRLRRNVKLIHVFMRGCALILMEPRESGKFSRVRAFGIYG